jgi:hypothetical protein
VKLQWESAQTDDPGDQLADSNGPGRSWYAIGPDTTTQESRAAELWSAELIVADDEGNEIETDCVFLGTYRGEEYAKAACQEWEDRFAERENDCVTIENLIGDLTDRRDRMRRSISDIALDGNLDSYALRSYYKAEETARLWGKVLELIEAQEDNDERDEVDALLVAIEKHRLDSLHWMFSHRSNLTMVNAIEDLKRDAYSEWLDDTFIRKIIKKYGGKR